MSCLAPRCRRGLHAPRTTTDRRKTTFRIVKSSPFNLHQSAKRCATSTVSQTPAFGKCTLTSRPQNALPLMAHSCPQSVLVEIDMEDGGSLCHGRAECTRRNHIFVGNRFMNEQTLPAVRRVAAVWAVLSMLGVVLAIPFLVSLLQGLDVPKRPPLPALILVSIVQTGLFSFLLAWGGAAAGRKLGVGSPLVEARLSKRRFAIGKTFGLAALLGVVGGVSVLALDAVFAPHMPASIRSAPPMPTALQGLLASFYGGISEEVLMRLGITTMAAWLWAHVVGFEGRGRTIALVFGVVFGAVVFGAAHLPLAFTIWPASPVVVARILLLNAVVGLLAGVVYVRRGIEHAVVLHFAADLVLYVVAPILRG